MLDLHRFSLKEVIPALSLIMDHQSQGNLYHGWRVAIIAYYLGNAVSPGEKNLIFYGGLLHDIGLFETGEVLANGDKDLEFQKSVPLFRNHPIVGAQIIKEIPGMQVAVNPILEHHEYLDGSGYPFGKKENEICLGAKILRAADCFDVYLRKNPDISQDNILRFIGLKENKEISPQLCSVLLKFDKIILSQIIDLQGIKNYFFSLLKEISSPQVFISRKQKDVMLNILSRAIDGKHHYTKEHSVRVVNYAVKIGERMGLGAKEIDNLAAAGYLHDIGKIAISNSILDKPGKLNSSEWEVIKTHPFVSYEIVKSVGCFRDIYEVVFADQEEYDGSGYPNGLKGQEIPFGARVIMVADAIDAMLSDRAYRRALPKKKVISELSQNSGTQFDPEIVKVAIDLITELKKN